MGKKRRDDFSEPLSDQHPTIPVHYCGNREQLGDGTGARKLPTNRPLIYVAEGFSIPGISRDEMMQDIITAANGWSPVCNLKFALAPSRSKAHIYVTDHNLGRSGTLADCQLWFGQEFPLSLRFNNLLQWSRSLRAPRGEFPVIPVGMHEIGHACSLLHFPIGPPPELMEPSISDIVSPQSTEGAIMAKLYGPPEVDVPTSPGSDEIELEISVKSLGKTVKFTGKKKW